ncbi:GNAT family N-acetyltransferase [Actinoplanes sp. NPDC026623]|uniref:GNAT family N-acetyltransferase n=1 Tax=Actinoplanes sp. NPDC026623 TaxID=3155610 RepID=UPI0033D8A4EC
MEIRQIAATERTDTMFPLQTYAFRPSPGADADRETYAQRMQYYRTAVSLIAEEGGRTLAGVGAFPMRQNVRDVVHDMAGVASVTTDPSARRRGFVRALVGRLLHEMHDRGCTVSALYPFRPSFYGRFGFVGLPRFRTATFAPEGLSGLLRADLPGEVERLAMREGFDDFDALTLRLLGERHGFSVFDEVRTAEFRESPARWVAIARVDGEVVGAVAYRIDDFGGDLVADDLLVTGPLGRALLLQFFARHVDQVARIVMKVGADDVPELWGTDLAVLTEGRVAFPNRGGPMARLLSMEALTGTATSATGAVTVEVADDEFIGGRYRLAGEGGRLIVEQCKDEPAATLTCSGISALAYGVLDPVEVVTRGFGQVDAAAIGPLTALFPRRMPYMFADF